MDALANLFGDDKKSKKKSTRPQSLIPKLNFNLTKFPSPAVLSFAIVCFLIAGGLLFVSGLIPQFGNAALRESVIESTRTFELEDEINGGLFSQTNRKGDTAHNIQSTFMGVSILNGQIKNAKGAKEFAQRLQVNNFDENLEYINYGVRLLKDLGLLDVSEYSAKSLVEKIYGQVLSHQEQGSGFKTTKFISPSVTASFYALDTLDVLGKLEEFRKLSEFSNVIQFILQQKLGGGFSDSEGLNATISSTFFATRALLFDASNQDTLREMGDISGFLYERQALNGGFLDFESENDFYNPAAAASSSQSLSTLEALYTLYALAEKEVEDDSVFSEFSSSTSKAASYLRAALKGGKGLRSSLSSPSPSLRGNYLFFIITEKFENFNYGNLNELKNIVFGFSFLFAVYGLFQFYREQVEDKRTLSYIVSSLRNVLLLSVVALLSFYFVPNFSILFYLVLFVYIGTRFYAALQSDANTNASDFLSPPLLTAFFQLLILILLNSSTNGNCFTTFYFYYVFTVWSAVSAFLSTYVFSALMQNKKTQLYLSSAFIGWVFTLITSILYITGSDSWSVALQLIQINGQFPLLFVVLPFVSLALSYFGALLPLSF